MEEEIIMASEWLAKMAGLPCFVYDYDQHVHMHLQSDTHTVQCGPALQKKHMQYSEDCVNEESPFASVHIHIWRGWDKEMCTT